MLVSDFDYYLPEELIAQDPVEPRDSSRLLVMNKETGELEHSVFRNLIQDVGNHTVGIFFHPSIDLTAGFCVKRGFEHIRAVEISIALEKIRIDGKIRRITKPNRVCKMEKI